MKIDLHKIKVRDIANGFKDSREEGVVAFNGNLNIRPKYQREFVYTGKQRDAVIQTVKQGFPLNVMYWVSLGEEKYEILDGQQRTISLCQYIDGDFSLNNFYFNNLTQEEKDEILDYELMIYFCEGTDKERLDWFRIINIAGEKLTDQELRNAVYTGTWLSDAKLKFSKTNCVAYLLANDGGALVTGSPIRQEYLERALSWISNGNIEDYMATHQHDSDAKELWEYFQDVIEWVRKIFPNYRREMKSVDWGVLYNKYKDISFDTKELESEVKKLLEDEDVTNASGVYPYVLSKDERYLNIRSFNEKEKRTAYERQNGICIKCKKHFDIEEMEADHIKPWVEGGKTTQENCQMLCKQDNRTKSNK